MTNATGSLRVFLSHLNHDRAWTEAFARALEQQGLSVWLDTKDIALGEQWSSKLETALRESDMVVIVLSEGSTSNPWLFFELGAALSLGKRVVPIVAKGVPFGDLPIPIRERRFLVQQTPEETADEFIAGTMIRKSA